MAIDRRVKEKEKEKKLVITSWLYSRTLIDYYRLGHTTLILIVVLFHWSTSIFTWIETALVTITHITINMRQRQVGPKVQRPRFSHCIVVFVATSRWWPALANNRFCMTAPRWLVRIISVATVVLPWHTDTCATATVARVRFSFHHLSKKTQITHKFNYY